MVPDSVFTLSGMKIPEGTGGLDHRFDPPRQLFAAGGVVREQTSRARVGWPRRSKRLNASRPRIGPLARRRDVPMPQAPDPGPTSSAGALAPNQEYRVVTRGVRIGTSRSREGVSRGDDRARPAGGVPEFGRLEWSYAERFLDLARKYLRDPVAIDALGGLVAARFCPPEAEQAAEILIRDHLKTDGLLSIYRQLATPFSAWSKGAERLLRAAADDGPTPDDRGQACLSLGLLLQNRAADLRKLRGRDPDPLMKLEELARSGGIEPAKRSDEEPDNLSKEAELFFDRVVQHYSVIKGKRAARRKGGQGTVQAPRAGRGKTGPGDRRNGRRRQAVPAERLSRQGRGRRLLRQLVRPLPGHVPARARARRAHQRQALSPF